MMTIRYTKLLAVLITLGLSACSSTDDVYERIAEIEEAREDRIAMQQEKMQEKAEETLDVAPDWFFEPPQADATGFFGVGYSKSKHMGHALKAAKLQAEFALAKMYKQELSGSERAFERGDSEGNVATQTTFLVDKIVDAVPVIGYDVIEQKMTPVEGVYETFVLLKLPYDEFNKVLQSQRQAELDTTVQAAFDDLERRLKDRRVEREQAAQAQHQRNIEQMEARSAMLKNQSEPVQNERPTISSDSGFE
jgi:hypothetical protein